jgi:hypothetical protein
MLCPERSAAHGKAWHLGGARIPAPQPVTPSVSTMEKWAWTATQPPTPVLKVGASDSDIQACSHVTEGIFAISARETTQVKLCCIKSRNGGFVLSSFTSPISIEQTPRSALDKRRMGLRSSSA